MNRFKTLIVDDEPLARNRLRRLLTEFAARVEIVGEAASGREALEKIASRQPDLVFLDIQMPGKDGFAVLQELNNPPRIIFVTAYDEFALRAFDANACDYLLKPVKRERLQQALDKLPVHPHPESGAGEFQKLLSYLEGETAHLERLTVRKGDRILFLEARKVVYFKAEDKYTFAVLEKGEEIVDYTLNELEKRLSPRNFVRIHRSHILNRSYLGELQRWSNGRYLAVLRDPRKTGLPISRGYLSNILPE